MWGRVDCIVDGEGVGCGLVMSEWMVVVAVFFSPHSIVIDYWKAGNKCVNERKKLREASPLRNFLFFFFHY